MDLSIIIVNWKSKAFLENCLKAISADMPHVPWECIVIDNASLDGSEELCAGFPWVRFFQSEKNLGFAGANNNAAEHATGKALLFLNPDTLPKPGAIGALLRGLSHTENAAIAGARLLNGDGSLQTSCVLPFPTVLNQLLDIEKIKKLTPHARVWGNAALFSLETTPQKVQAVSGASLMMRKDIFIKVGGFSREYFMYGEDIDLCEKTRRAGFDIILVNSAVITHFGGASSAQSSRAWYEAVLLRETNTILLCKFKDPFQVIAYRGTTFLSALLRCLLLCSTFAFMLIPDTRARWFNALRKWIHVLNWSFGGERWSRKKVMEMAV